MSDDIRKAAQALVDAMDDVDNFRPFLGTSQHIALADLRAALAAPEPQPVAWMFELKAGEYAFCRAVDAEASKAMLTPANHAKPLYTAPPSREWQGLTNEEVVYTTFKTENEYCTPGWCMDFARAIESALKAKNTGEQA